MWWYDLSAVALAFVAIWLRWHDDPKGAALIAYLSVACSQAAHRRARGRREMATRED